MVHCYVHFAFVFTLSYFTTYQLHLSAVSCAEIYKTAVKNQKARSSAIVSPSVSALCACRVARSGRSELAAFVNQRPVRVSVASAHVPAHNERHSTRTRRRASAINTASYRSR